MGQFINDVTFLGGWGGSRGQQKLQRETVLGVRGRGGYKRDKKDFDHPPEKKKKAKNTIVLDRHNPRRRREENKGII